VTAVAVAGEPVATRSPEPRSDLAIHTTGLTKRFGSVAVVDGIDLAVPVGSVFGFLGPNGSGKTTTIRMLLGLIAPSAGDLRLLGRDLGAGLDAALPRVGALVEGPAFYPWLSGWDNLARFDRAGPDPRRPSRRRRIGEALERVGLSAAAGKRYRAYSLGMRQRLGLAAALLRPRDLLILDEPTNGMDPQGTREIRQLVRALAAEGATIFLSSHLLAEIEQICTHVGVMHLGRLVAQSALADLEAGAPRHLRVETPDAGLAEAVLRAHGLCPDTVAASVTAELRPDDRPETLCRALVLADVRVAGLGIERPSLEDIFVGLTGEGFDVAR
jgi:ABC-2 type transport system ATP-binding protein